MSAIYVYYEGDPELKAGYAAFFQAVREAAQRLRIPFRLVAGQGRVVRDFMIALRANGDAFNVLLLDAERADDGTLRAELEGRGDWQPPRGVIVSPEQVHFMVQCMESWFLADLDALEAYYGQGFHRGSFPANQLIEAVPKQDVFRALKNATHNTQKKEYHKTRHAPELLARIRPAEVRARSPHCDRLFDVLLAHLA